MRFTTRITLKKVEEYNEHMVNKTSQIGEGTSLGSRTPQAFLWPLEKYLKIPVIKALGRGFLVSKQKTFWQGSLILGILVWLHSNNCRKGTVACLNQEGRITGIMFCRQTDVLITGWAYNRDFTLWT